MDYYFIHTVKEWESCMPFSKKNTRMTAEMVLQEMFWLNSFYAVAKSPRSVLKMVSWTGHFFTKDSTFEFVRYVQIHAENDKTNQSRTA